MYPKAFLNDETTLNISVIYINVIYTFRASNTNIP